MKITPLILFFILLVVLVLSIVFSKYLPLRKMKEGIKEGLIGFNSSTPSAQINIDFYSNLSEKKVTQLYDNLYFDTKNGNLIEVDGKMSTDTTGSTDINKVYVISRDQTTVEYIIPQDSPKSKISGVSENYSQFIYSTKCRNTDTYYVVYISYNKETLIHIFKINTGTPITFTLIKSMLFNDDPSSLTVDWNSSSGKVVAEGTSLNSSSLNIGNVRAESEDKNKTIVESGYNTTTIYKLSRSVFYDIYTGNLVLKHVFDNGSTPTYKIYDRNGNNITERQTPPSLVSVSAYSPWMIVDPDNNLVIVNPYYNKTIICILKLDSTSGTIAIGNIVRFNSNSVDNGGSVSGSVSSSVSDGLTGEYCSVTDMECLLKNVMKKWDVKGNDDSSKWLAYWNTLVSSGDTSSSDYILKSQIVPPVCPQCPSCNCNGGGVCSDCGGNGGGGLKKGNTGMNAPSITNDILNKNDRDTDNRFVNNLGQTVSDVTGDVTGLAGSAIGTAGGLAGSAIGTVGGVVNNAVNTAGGLLYSAGSGATNLLRSAGGNGPVGLNYQNTQGGQGGQRDTHYSSENNKNTPIDNYSQYGALQTKGGNYMPVTADFSAFGR